MHGSGTLEPDERVSAVTPCVNTVLRNHHIYIAAVLYLTLDLSLNSNYFFLLQHLQYEDGPRSMHQPRQILAYGILSIFVVFVLFYGIADSVLRMYPTSGMKGFSGAIPESASICMYSATPTPCLDT